MNLFYFLKNEKLKNKLKIRFLNKKRKKIDKINKIILNNILKRTILAKEIIELKLNMNYEIEDKKRENEIKKDIKDYLINKLKILSRKNLNLNEKLIVEKIDEVFEILFLISKN